MKKTAKTLFLLLLAALLLTLPLTEAVAAAAHPNAGSVDSLNGFKRQKSSDNGFVRFLRQIADWFRRLFSAVRNWFDTDSAAADEPTTQPSTAPVSEPAAEPSTEPSTEPATEPTEPSAPTPSELLQQLNVPALRSREEMLEILQREEYGFLPAPPESLTFTVLEENIRPELCVGKAVVNKLQASGTWNGRAFSFPFYETMPTDGQQHPFFIHNNFRDEIPDKYMPTEDLVDQGFAVLSLCYLDVTSDPEDGPGKIALWAWAAQRVMDYAETRTDVLDLSRAVICGHSRLGKTALFTAATDTRFTYCYSNDAGCSGDALARANSKDAGNETVAQMIKRYAFWYCENYRQYADHEADMPFDQHYLIACIAPRRVLLGSASLDTWANPAAQQLSALAASPAFNVGLAAPDRFAEIGEAFLQGDLGFHKREGEHFFKPADWQRLIEFVNLHG